MKICIFLLISTLFVNCCIATNSTSDKIRSRTEYEGRIFGGQHEEKMHYVLLDCILEAQNQNEKQSTGVLGTTYCSPIGNFDFVSNDKIQLFRKGVLQIFLQQLEKVCPDNLHKIERAYFENAECVGKLDQANQTKCYQFRNNALPRCNAPYLNALKECIPRDKEVIDLVYQGLISALTFLCNTNGEQLFEIANSCWLRMNNNSLMCVNKFKTQIEEMNVKPITKTSFCYFLNSARPCFHDHVWSSCGNPLTRETIEGLFDAIARPCKNEEDDESREYIDSSE